MFMLRLQRWVGSGHTHAGLFSASSGRKYPQNVEAVKHVRLLTGLSDSVVMAEEAKKLAGYAAVDNHVQVRNVRV